MRPIRQSIYVMFLALGLLSLHGAAVHAQLFPAVIALDELDGSRGFRLQSLEDRDDCGWSVSAAGDFNGDGIDDAMITAIGGQGEPDVFDGGTAYIIFGRLAPFAAEETLYYLDGQSGFAVHGRDSDDEMGRSSSFGDINGDQLSDLVLGAPVADANGFRAGEAYVVFGDPSPPGRLSVADLDGTNGFRLTGLESSDSLGSGVASGGDLDGDGFDELVVGATGVAGDAGEVYVLFGGPSFPADVDVSSLDGTDGFALEGAVISDRTGNSVAIVGDADGDGHDELLVGAPGAGNDRGTSYLIFGHARPFPERIDLALLDPATGIVIRGANPGEQSGTVSEVGDVNGDGLQDLLIGAPLVSEGGTWVGAAYVVYGRSQLPAEIDLALVDGTNGFRMLGKNSEDMAGSSLGPPETSTVTASRTSSSEPAKRIPADSNGQARPTSSSAVRPVTRRSTSEPLTESTALPSKEETQGPRRASASTAEETSTVTESMT